jgi:hypothetical protein
MDKNLITSTLGFKFDVDIIDKDGEFIAKGYKTILPSTDGVPNIGNRIGGETWFTNFNKDLLAKIRDYKRLNL